MKNGETLSAIMQEIEQSDSLYLANRNNEAVFHCIELKSIGPCRKYPLFEGFDILYYHQEEKDRIKEIAGDVFHVVKRELKHQKQKLPRLLKEYDEALDCMRWKTYGDLLYMYQVGDTRGTTEIELEDYETGEKGIIIEIKIASKFSEMEKECDKSIIRDDTKEISAF